MAAKHLVIARTRGMDAGLAAFMAAPSSRLSQNYDGIVSKRTPKTRLAAYCNIFGEKVTSLRDKSLPKASAPVGDTRLDRLEAAIAALTGTVITPESTDEVEEVTSIEVPTSDEFVTSGVAWACLGGTISPPNDMTKAATNGQLFAMNTQGLFSAEEVSRLNALALVS